MRLTTLVLVCAVLPVAGCADGPGSDGWKYAGELELDRKFRGDDL